MTCSEAERWLAEASAQQRTIRVIIGKREFTGTLTALGSERPAIMVIVPVSKTGACVELCEHFSRLNLARLLAQGFINWPTTSHNRMKPTRPIKHTKR